MVPHCSGEEAVEGHAAAELRGIDVHRGLVLDDVPDIRDRELRLRYVGGVEVVPGPGAVKAQELNGVRDLGGEEHRADALVGVPHRVSGLCGISGVKVV